ncbi:MAG TPA: hypothetical protein VJR92_08600 [Gemmatimonadaceae bacterium]|nr:hypothetical protein [Gemmatimonadaceae bacterium]
MKFEIKFDRKFEQLAARGALGVVGGVLLVYLGIAWSASLTPVAGVPGATGGMEPITRNVLWIAALVPVAIFVWSHVAFAKQLQRGPTSLND